MPTDLLTAVLTDLALDRRFCLYEVTGEYCQGALRVAGRVYPQQVKDQLLSALRARTSAPIIDAIETLPDLSVGSAKAAVVRVSVANCHALPSVKAPVLTQVLLGTILQVLERVGEWVRVVLPDGYIGWMSGQLALLDVKEWQAFVCSERIVVTADTAWVLSGMEPWSERVGDVCAGSVLQCVKHSVAHDLVRFPDGRSGYVPNSETQPLDEWLCRPLPSPQQIIRTAKRFMGVPYLWGGLSPKALDCSGLVWLSYFLGGILLPRDSDVQALCGVALSIHSGWDSLQPGDLLFFADSPGAPISHVALSLGGSGALQASGDVNCFDLDPGSGAYDPVRAKTLVAAKRVLGATHPQVRHLALVPGYGCPFL